VDIVEEKLGMRGLHRRDAWVGEAGECPDSRCECWHEGRCSEAKPFHSMGWTSNVHSILYCSLTFAPPTRNS
jgi:hypothetical protein